MQPSLFDPDGPDDPAACMWPDLAPGSAYRYGCRCPRCRTDKRAVAAPLCSYPGCDRPKVAGSGRRYCPDHAVVPGAPGAAPMVVECGVCGAPFVVRMRTASHPTTRVLLCPAHRPFAAAVLVWAKHHVALDLQRRWLLDPVCWICGNAVDLTRRGTGRAPVVDHDHRCGCGAYSCGLCVRGLAHQRCNLYLGQLEGAVVLLGPARVAALAALVGGDHDASDPAFFNGRVPP
jgi:hypothetical protein